MPSRETSAFYRPFDPVGGGSMLICHFKAMERVQIEQMTDTLAMAPTNRIAMFILVA